MNRDELIWRIQLRLRREVASRPDFYQPSPGQLQDHVNNRVARAVVDEIEQWMGGQ